MSFSCLWNSVVIVTPVIVFLGCGKGDQGPQPVALGAGYAMRTWAHQMPNKGGLEALSRHQEQAVYVILEVVSTTGAPQSTAAAHYFDFGIENSLTALCGNAAVRWSSFVKEITPVPNTERYFLSFASCPCSEQDLVLALDAASIGLESTPLTIADLCEA